MSTNQLTVILIGIILILSFALGLTYRSGLKWKVEADRNRVNVAALTAQKGKDAIVQQLTRSELDKRYGKIIDSLNYRIKRVAGLATVRIEKEVRYRDRWRDTIMIEHDTIRLGRFINIVDSCLNITVTDRLDTADVAVKVDITAHAIVYRGERIHPWYKFWRTERIPKVAVHSSCGSVVVESVEVVR